MESLPDGKLLKFHPDTLKYMREQYNFDKPGQMDEAIDLLDEWIKKQNHFTVRDFPRSYLERQIILDKGSVERAKFQMEKMFTMKTIASNFFNKFDAKKDFAEVRDVFIQALIPKLTPDHYRIYIGRIINPLTATHLTKAYELGTLFFEYLRANEYCNGFIGVLDYRYLNILEFISVINIVELRQFVGLLTEGYQMRLKAIHILTASKGIEMLVKIFKSVFSDKIGNRIQVHMSLESLHQYISKDLLPEDLGGEQKPLLDINDEMMEVLSTKENIAYFREMSKARTDETRRCGGNIYSDDVMAMSGTFRTLSVD